jgi:O-acetyl-ADP-ribose deacetylase (regulator of RNase III)
MGGSVSANLRIHIVVGDITRQQVDAVVNAANERMLGGGGVDGAIHAAAGPELLEACRAVPEVRPGVRCPTGESRITSGFRLPARFVVHTVGPVWRGGNARESELLAACYRSSLELAFSRGARSIAFPCISTGAFGFPTPLACKIAVREVADFLASHPSLERALLVAFNQKDAESLRGALPAKPLDPAKPAPHNRGKHDP